MAFGVTPQGFKRKRAEDLKKDLENYVLDELGPNTPVEDGPIAKVIGIVAKVGGELWEAAEASYNSFDPEKADGAALDNLLALIDLTRNKATRSQGTIEITGDEGTFIEAGFEVRNPDTDARFVTTEDATIPDDGDPNTSAGTVSVPIEATETGPIDSKANTITEAVTVNAGVDSVTNPSDVTPGQDAETAAEARIRRKKSLQVLGKGTVAGIEGELLDLDYIGAARVLENDTGSVDANGQDPYSMRVVVYPDVTTAEDKEEVAKLLWTHKGGNTFVGTDVVANVTDEDTGLTRAVRWDHASEVNVWIDVTVTTDSDYPSDGDDQVERAVQDTISALSVGDDVRVLALYGAIDQVAGVLTADIKLGETSSPTGSSDISVGPDEVRYLKNVTVTSS